MHGQDTLVHAAKRPYAGIIVGINGCKLPNDTLNLSYGIYPTLGASLTVPLGKLFNLKGSLTYSLKGSISDMPYVKFRSSYLDFAIIPELKIFNDLYLQSGWNYSALLQPTHEASGFASEFNIASGIELKLQRNVNLAFNYYIPISYDNSKNFRLTINVLLKNRPDKKPGFRKLRIEKSKQQIKDLKNGVLLVNLKSSEKKIKALMDTGRLKKAAKVRYNQEKDNKDIIRAFKSSFNFCPVLFFYDNNSNKVINRNFTGIFLNDSLETDLSIQLDASKTIFIAEFGLIGNDTSGYFSHYSYGRDSTGNLIKVKNYYGENGFQLLALHIQDNNFIELRRPFPHYTDAIFMTIRKHPEYYLFFPPFFLSSLTWSFDAVVKRMNDKLVDYYSETEQVK